MDKTVEEWPKDSQIPQPLKKTGRSSPPRKNIEQVTSSEDDEYVSAFSSKPRLKPDVRLSATGNDLRGVPDDTGPSDKLKQSSAETTKSASDLTTNIDNERPVEDKNGNALIGLFCPFALVAKFPYKYMVDTNDTVSRHFFANNKFYDRTWDM